MILIGWWFIEDWWESCIDQFLQHIISDSAQESSIGWSILSRTLDFVRALREKSFSIKHCSEKQLLTSSKSIPVHTNFLNVLMSIFYNMYWIPKTVAVGDLKSILHYYFSNLQVLSLSTFLDGFRLFVSNKLGGLAFQFDKIFFFPSTPVYALTAFTSKSIHTQSVINAKSYF